MTTSPRAHARARDRNRIARPAVAPYHENEHDARIWHGWTKPADAKTYEKLLRDEIFPSIAARKIDGYRGAELFIRDDGDEVEFVTLLRFDSMDAVTKFAGPEAK